MQSDAKLQLVSSAPAWTEWQLVYATLTLLVMATTERVIAAYEVTMKPSITIVNITYHRTFAGDTREIYRRLEACNLDNDIWTAVNSLTTRITNAVDGLLRQLRMALGTFSIGSTGSNSLSDCVIVSIDIKISDNSYDLQPLSQLGIATFDIRTLNLTRLYASGRVIQAQKFSTYRYFQGT
jgi:hypothetical protein